MNRDNNYDDYSNRNRNNDRNDRNDNNRNDSEGRDGKAQLFIAKGRNDGMDAQQIIDFISLELNLDQTTISNVKILDAFSFVSVPAEDADEILDFFQKKAGDGRPVGSRAKRKTESNRSGGFGRDNRDRDNRGGERRSFGDRDRDDRRGGNGGGNYSRNNNNRSDYGNKPRRNSDY